jgi:glyoxylase-like metal-dependent hydrolase (beta-lactamase superfamily II)
MRNKLKGKEMKPPFEITPGVYMVGGPDLTAAEDACIYLLDIGNPILIDSGSGSNNKGLVSNLRILGYKPEQISLVVLTHAHIDHAGGAPWLADRYGLKLAMHEADAAAVEEGDQERTAARWYGRTFPATRVKVRLSGEEGTIDAGAAPLHWLHTPGHTPGSVSLWVEAGIQRVLFAQDVHGPFYEVFGSDIDVWADSMRRLIALEADILCEGHFGIYRPASEVRRYIEDYLKNFGRF